MANFSRHKFSAAALAELKGVEKYVDEYAAHADIYRRDGLSVRDIVESHFADDGRELSAELEQSLMTLQEDFGAINDPATFLGRDL